jgi:L-lactate dehydrogenase complex protein LldF
MPVDSSAPYRKRVAQALGDDGLRTALDRATGRLRSHRLAAMQDIDVERLREEVRAVREYSVSNLPDLLEQLEQNLTANGCVVHWARDAAEANEIVREIADEHNVQQVAKSKSMTTEEIGLNEALEHADIEVVETDLGEYIIQLAGEPPSHLTAPVIHKRVEDISKLFEQEFGIAPTTNPADLCAVARNQLRSKFLRADMGISGGNFAVAESGTVCIVTNEGNGRMVTSMPRVYVAIVGIEKVVPRLEDAILLWQAAARSATGQDVTVYFSMSSGPRGEGHPDGPEEMHVVLLDNGRSRLLERGYADALLCIRCGACVNECPVYREIGGHAYGRTAYSGPIGAVVTPLLADDMTSAKELPFASSLCGACLDVCPAKIDLPRLLLDLRHDLVLLKSGTNAERLGMRLFASAAKRRFTFEWLTRLGRWATGLLSGRDGEVRRLPPPLSGWTKYRSFPKLAASGFRKLWAERKPGRESGRG